MNQIDQHTMIDSAAQLFQAKDFAKALPVYAILRDLSPDDPFFADRHAHCLIALEDWQSALQAWLSVVSCHGLTAMRLNFVAQCLIELQEYQVARTMLQRQKAILPRLPRHFVLATLAAIGGDDPGEATQSVLDMAALPQDEAVQAFDEMVWRLDRLSRAGHAARILDWLARALPKLTKEQPFLRVGMSLAISQLRWERQKNGSQPEANIPSGHNDVSDAKADAAAAQAAIAAAQSLARDHGAKAGFNLLLESRPTYKTVPPQLDGTLGRMALRAGMMADALAYLERARLSFRVPPPWVYRALGCTLLTMDRATSAGRNFHLATQSGAEIFDINEQIAMQDFPAPPLPGTSIEYRHVHGLSFLDEARGISYLSIPKNACSILKATFIMNSAFREAYLESKQTIHEFYPVAATSIDAAKAIAANPARIVVLRDPLTRLVSCYLNKFARPAEQNLGMLQTISLTVEKVQARLGLTQDFKRSISFAEFVSYVAKAPDAACDLHWIPQHRICGEDMSIYAHIGRFERLDATLEVLQARYGMVIETSVAPHITFAETHATRHDPAAADRQAWTMLPEELRAMKQGFPPTAAFYNDDLRNIVRQRYAVDTRLHASA